MRPVHAIVAFLFIVCQTSAQVINRAEYFFDADPGTGNGTAIPFTPATTININFNANINALSPGFHTLNVRTRDSNGTWSHFQTRTLFVFVAAATGVNITKAEYFFDSDPGFGNGTSVAVAVAPSINQNLAVSTNTLPTGFHTFNYRVRDDKGQWSQFATRTFYIVPPVATTASTNIIRAEYFLDHDPGTGLATNLPITVGGSISANVAIPTTSIGQGFHSLGVRVLDDKGRWSHFANRTFYVIGTPSVTSSLNKAEYFFDHDPGVGNAIPLPITAGSSQTNSFALDISSLTGGFHVFAIRYRDNTGKWSLFMQQSFYVIPANSLPATKVTRLEYFVDTDPGVGLASGLPFTPVASVDQTFAITLSGVGSGAHKLYVRARDDQGFWSVPLSSDFSVLACTPPAAPTSPGGSRCNTGTVSLTASGATGGQQYHWYSDPTSPAILFNGSPFTTPSIAATTTFYVTVFDPTTLCESSRTPSIASVVTTSPPVLNVSGNVTICQGNSIALIAPAGFSSYLWSTGATSQQIVVNTAGTYTAQVGNGSCQSLPSLPAVISLATRPNKPSASATGSLCSGSLVTLQGPSGFSSYLWSTGATTQQTSVTQPGSYSLIVSDANGCASVSSDPVVVDGPPSKPSLVVVGNVTICEGGSVTLVGPSGFASYLWSSGATTQQLTVSSTGNFTLQVTDGSGCNSTVSDPIAVTVNSSPAKPTITASGSTSFCLGQSITLSAPAGFQYVWSTGAATQEITVNQSGTFTLVVRDGNGCLSPLSDPIIATAASCTNGHPPAIQDKVILAPVEGIATENLIDWFSDPDNDLDIATLAIVRPLNSGAVASIDASQKLTIDYTSTLFSGEETLTLEICDLAHNCTRKDVTIRVVGEVIVFNGVSPNGDGLNDVLFLEYIDLLEEAKLNRVRIFNRWGDVVYDAENYNNSSIAFTGIGTNGDILATGTYFYRIDFKSGIPYRTGFISLRK